MLATLAMLNGMKQRHSSKRTQHATGAFAGTSC
jgi:hypothetical protein